MNSSLCVIGQKCGQAAVFLLIASAISIQPASAQSQDRQQDIQQLKDKLQQLEQTMGEVKAELNRLEATPPSTSTTPAPTQAGAQKKPAQPEAPSGELVPMEGEITQQQDTVDFYGFAMLDSGYNFGQIDPNWYDVVRPTKLPAYPNEFGGSGNVFAGVRQTRFGVKSSTPTHLGDLNTIFEFELFGTGVDAGQTTFRLRHAYGELGKVGAGQTWSPFMDIGVFPNSVEYWGPNGMVFFRNIQVRWMPVRNKRTNVTIALERPGASGDQGVYADRIELSNITPRFNFPDLSGHFRIMGNWGYLQTAAIVRKIGWNDTSNNTTNLGDSVVGWGINLTSNLNLGKNTVAKLAYTYGHGTENYMNDAPFDIGIENNVGVVHNSQGQIVPFKGVALPVTGVVAFLDHTWDEHQHFTSTAGYSMVNISNSDAELASDFHQGHYALANILFHPIPKVMMGPEFQFGRRVNYLDGFNYNDYRVQFSFKYDWSKGFKSPSFCVWLPRKDTKRIVDVHWKRVCQNLNGRDQASNLVHMNSDRAKENHNENEADANSAPCGYGRHGCFSRWNISSNQAIQPCSSPQRTRSFSNSRGLRQIQERNQGEERRLHSLSRAGGFQAIRHCNRHYRQSGFYQGRRDLFLLHPINLQSLYAGACNGISGAGRRL